MWSWLYQDTSDLHYIGFYYHPYVPATWKQKWLFTMPKLCKGSHTTMSLQQFFHGQITAADSYFNNCNIPNRKVLGRVSNDCWRESYLKVEYALCWKRSGRSNDRNDSIEKLKIFVPRSLCCEMSFSVSWLAYVIMFENLCFQRIITEIEVMKWNKMNSLFNLKTIGFTYFPMNAYPKKK